MRCPVEFVAGVRSIYLDECIMPSLRIDTLCDIFSAEALEAGKPVVQARMIHACA